MPQARSGGSGSRSGARSKRSTTGSSSGAKRAGTASRTSRSTSTGSSSARPTSARSKSAGSAATASKATSGVADARLEAVAQRLRKLNERIIEAGKEAGETTLTSYERALKAIATSIERGPGSSEIEWVSHLATIQARWIRDVTTAITSAARDAMK